MAVARIQVLANSMKGGGDEDVSCQSCAAPRFRSHSRGAGKGVRRHAWYELRVISASASSPPNDQSLLYEWTFGDGASAAGMDLTNPGHAYAEPGIYLVDLKVSDSTGSFDEAHGAITIQDLNALYVEITPPYQEGTRGSAVLFS
jgi:hypothetical protein